MASTAARARAASDGPVDSVTGDGRVIDATMVLLPPADIGSVVMTWTLVTLLLDARLLAKNPDACPVDAGLETLLPAVPPNT